MRSGYSSTLALSDAGWGIQRFIKRLLARVAGLALLAGGAAAVASLATWNVADPSFSHATDNVVTNALGYPGAVFSDLALQFFGLSALAALVPGLIWGLMLAAGRSIDRPLRRGLAWLGTALLMAAMAGCIVAPDTWPLPSGLGGVLGDMVLAVPSLILGGYPTGWRGILMMAVLAGPTLWLFLRAAGLRGGNNVSDTVTAEDDFDADEDGDDAEGPAALALGAVTHWWLSIRADRKSVV